MTTRTPSGGSDGGLLRVLTGYEPASPAEARDHARVLRLIRTATDPGAPWDRAQPLHLTASAVIVHPPSGRLLLRWHQRQQGWLHVGGHGDPGEHDPLAIAVREAAEETGLEDVVPWPDARLVHLDVVDVPASAAEPAHEHADLRFVLATATPEAAAPEGPGSPVRWAGLDDAAALVTSSSLHTTLSRIAPLLHASSR